MLQRGCADIATPPVPEIRPKWHAFLMAYGWLRGREVVRSVAEAASERVIKRVGLDIELNVEIALDLVEHRFGEASVYSSLSSAGTGPSGKAIRRAVLRMPAARLSPKYSKPAAPRSIWS